MSTLLLNAWLACGRLIADCRSVAVAKRIPQSAGKRLRAGKLLKTGKQPINSRLEVHCNVEHPDAGLDWSPGFAVGIILLPH